MRYSASEAKFANILFTVLWLTSLPAHLVMAQDRPRGSDPVAPGATGVLAAALQGLRIQKEMLSAWLVPS